AVFWAGGRKDGAPVPARVRVAELEKGRVVEASGCDTAAMTARDAKPAGGTHRGGPPLEARRPVDGGASEPSSAANGGSTRVLVGCGQSLSGQTIVIVRSDGSAARQPGEIGEIWVAGPGVAAGYWKRLAGAAKTFPAPPLRRASARA